MRIVNSLSLIVILAACGSREATPVRSAEEVVAHVDHAAPEEEAPLIPACDASAEECVPPAQWVSKLCSGVHPEVALHMFRGGSPWKRVYSRYRAPAFNGSSNGASLSEERVEKGEELIALRRNNNGRGSAAGESDGRGSAAGEMSVGDTAGYDLLRWNGSCVTLHDGEYSDRAPRRREHARVEWRWLGDEVRSALQTDGTIKEAYVARRKECKGATIGRVTKKCVEREDSLVAAIVDYVRAGGELPEPNEQL